MLLTLEDSKILKGIAISLVLVHHFVQHYADSCPAWLIIFKSVGPIACALFFFLSGYGISLQSTDNKRTYWFRRFVLILIPFLCANSFCVICKLILGSYYTSILPVLSDISGITLANPTYWFIHCLLFMYTGFFLSSRKRVFVKIIMCIMMGSLYTIVSKNIGGLSWMAFPLGIWMAYEKQYIHKLTLYIAILVCILSISFYYANEMKVNAPILLINFIAMVLSFPIASLSIRVRNHRFKSIASFLGTHSMEYYLMHFIMLILAKHLTISTLIGGGIYFSTTVVISSVFGILSHFLTSKILYQK